MKKTTKKAAPTAPATSMRKLDRFQILHVESRGDEPVPGPKWVRVDCTVPGVGVEVWCELVVMQAVHGSRFTLEKLHPSLTAAGNPPLTQDQGAVIEWLVQAISAQPIGDTIRAALDARDQAEQAKSDAQRLEELMKAKATVEAAEKRKRDSEVT